MKSGLVSIAISIASGPRRSRIGRVNVPTPGPYSTNSRVRDQSTGLSMRSIRILLDGITDPTMTGCFRKPRRNCHRGLLRPRPARNWWRRWPFKWLTRLAFKAGSNDMKDGCVRKRRSAWQGKWTAIAHALASICLRNAPSSYPPARCRQRADEKALPPPLCRHARRRGGQYRAPVGHARDRPRNRYLRLLGHGFLYLVRGPLGGARPFLGEEKRPAWPQEAD